MLVKHSRQIALLSIEVVAVGEVVDAEVAGGGYDDELAGGFQEVEVVAVLGMANIPARRRRWRRCRGRRGRRAEWGCG